MLGVHSLHLCARRDTKQIDVMLGKIFPI